MEDASAPDEVTALQNRCDNAYRDAAARGCDAKLREFETAVAGRSRAIFACPLTKLMPLATGQHDLYAPYYRLAELRLPKGPPAGEPNWEVIRPVVETALFGEQFKRDVHYAALTLDGQALASYGECFVLLRERMVAHRASVFEENSILFMKHHDIKIFEVDRLPTGYRARWEDRGKLAATKLASQVDPHTPADQFAGVLMRPASSRARDYFIEIHLFGPMTALTFEKVTFVPLKSSGAGKAKKRKRHRPRRGDTNLRILADRLAAAGAEFESRA